MQGIDGRNGNTGPKGVQPCSSMSQCVATCRVKQIATCAKYGVALYLHLLAVASMKKVHD